MEKGIIENVRSALDLAVKYGNTYIRAFADTDIKTKPEGVKADIGLVSDPQTGPLHARVKDLYNAGVSVALGIKNFKLTVGNEANIVILGVDSTVKALWSHEAPVAVIKNITVE